MSPSVETLSRIAEGLCVWPSRFFSDQRSRSDLSLVRAGHGIVVDCIGALENCRYELEQPSSMSNVVDTKET